MTICKLSSVLYDSKLVQLAVVSAPNMVPKNWADRALERVHVEIFRRYGGVNTARPLHFQIWSQICPATQFTLGRGQGDWGACPAICIGCIGAPAMGTEYSQRTQGHLIEPSLLADEPTDDALSLLDKDALREDEASLWGDEPTADVQALLEENARLRALVAQLSDLIRKNAVHQR